MRLLLTRPAAEAQGSIVRLRALGHSAISVPMLKIVPLACALPPGDWQGVLVTSAHGAQFLADEHRRRLAGVPVLAVGDRSAQAARAAGFSNVVSARGNEAALALLVKQSLPQGSRLLYLAGHERRGGLERLLATYGFTCEIVETYDAVAAKALPVDVGASLRQGHLDAVLHYSARTASLFVKVAASAGLAEEIKALIHLCLSTQVAAQLAFVAPEQVKVAKAPNEEALFALLETM